MEPSKIEQTAKAAMANALSELETQLEKLPPSVLAERPAIAKTIAVMRQHLDSASAGAAQPGVLDGIAETTTHALGDAAHRIEDVTRDVVDRVGPLAAAALGTAASAVGGFAKRLIDAAQGAAQGAVHGAVHSAPADAHVPVVNAAPVAPVESAVNAAAEAVRTAADKAEKLMKATADGALRP